jgi:hypothetical protein
LYYSIALGLGYSGSSSTKRFDYSFNMGFALKKPAGVPGKSWPAILIGMFVAFGGVLFGYGIPLSDAWPSLILIPIQI